MIKSLNLSRCGSINWMAGLWMAGLWMMALVSLSLAQESESSSRLLLKSSLGNSASNLTHPKSLSVLRVSEDKSHFVNARGERFRVWGVNYDHDATGRLMDEYWIEEWPKVVEDFQEIKALGANAVRVHLQFGKFMNSPSEPNQIALTQLTKLIELAEEVGLYLNITGLACYHKKNIPDWYDRLSEEARWQAQAEFWRAIAQTCKHSQAVFCYDLMNEPIVPSGKIESEYLTGELSGKYFVQRIALDPRGRTQKQIAAAWVDKLCKSIREVDDRHLITVGVIPWVFVFGGGSPLFYSPEVAEPLDFVSVHFYPESSKLDKALEALKKYDIGKPMVIEEFFPLKCSLDEAATFVERSSIDIDGYFSFYWGQTPTELTSIAKPTIAESITANWLRKFTELGQRFGDATAATVR